MFKMVKENDMFYSVYFTDVYASYVFIPKHVTMNSHVTRSHTNTHTNKYANIHQSLITQ